VERQLISGSSTGGGSRFSPRPQRWRAAEPNSSIPGEAAARAGRGRGGHADLKRCFFLWTLGKPLPTSRREAANEHAKSPEADKGKGKVARGSFPTTRVFIVVAMLLAKAC